MSHDDLHAGLSSLPTRMWEVICGMLVCSSRNRDAFVSAFDDMERTDIEPASHLISRADYLNASARPEAARVRAFVDQLLGQYPAAKRDDLIRRIRSRDDSHHGSAWFELLLHGLMVARGFTIVEVKPRLSNGRSPDFLVAAPDGREFFLEATVAEGEIEADPGADRRMRDVLQAIDLVGSPDFFLNLHCQRRTIALLPDREPATTQAWLAGQPQIEIVARDRGGGYAGSTVCPSRSARAMRKARQRVLGIGLIGAPLTSPTALLHLPRSAISTLNKGRPRCPIGDQFAVV